MKEYQKVRNCFTNCPECGIVNENMMDADVGIECGNCHCVYDDLDLQKAELKVPKNHNYRRLSMQRIEKIKKIYVSPDVLYYCGDD